MPMAAPQTTAPAHTSPEEWRRTETGTAAESGRAMIKIKPRRPIRSYNRPDPTATLKTLSQERHPFPNTAVSDQGPEAGRPNYVRGSLGAWPTGTAVSALKNAFGRMSVTDRGSGWLSEVSENDVYADAASHLVSGDHDHPGENPTEQRHQHPPQSTVRPRYRSSHSCRNYLDVQYRYNHSKVVMFNFL